MSAAKSVNGYFDQQGEGWPVGDTAANGENMCRAVALLKPWRFLEVASALELEHPKPKRRGKDEN